MKTLKQFIEAPKKPKDPSKTAAVDRMKTQHSRQRDALADRSKVDKERQSTEFQQMATQQKGELERAKQTDKASRLRKSSADKKEKQQAKRK